MDPRHDLRPGDHVTYYHHKTTWTYPLRPHTLIHSVSGVFVKYTGKFRHACICAPNKKHKIKYEDNKHRVVHIKTKFIWCVIRNGIFLYTSK